MSIFTSPEDLIGFARDNGLQAQGYNHGSWPEQIDDEASHRVAARSRAVRSRQEFCRFVS